MALFSKTVKWLRKQLEPGFWLAALTVLFLLPENISERSLCVFSLLGFEHCPGCGIGHSMHYALHLQFSLSFHHHPLGIFGVLVIFNRLKQLIYPAKTAYETQSH